MVTALLSTYVVANMGIVAAFLWEPQPLHGSKRMAHKNIDWESVVFILKQRIKAVKDLLKDEAKKSKAKNTKTS